MEITKEMCEAYWIVRRSYAEEDVRRWLVDNDIDPDEYPYFEELVDRYDDWQGDNDEWYEEIGWLKDLIDVEEA